jgi:hypothetical protein
MSYDRDINVMEQFFGGRINAPEMKKSEPRMVELGHGTGIGHKDGSYTEYNAALYHQASKGNGIISIGKSVNIDNNKNLLTMDDSTDKFSFSDVPHVLIMFYNIVNETRLKVLWMDHSGDIIVDQYYKIPSSYSMGNSWWDQYGVYFIGPEDLDEGDYKVEITSTSLGAENRIKSLTATLKFSVTEEEIKEEIKEIKEEKKSKEEESK